MAIAKRAREFTFYLGVHRPEWLARTDVPLFLSRRVVAGRRTLPRERGPWALDSGGFSELSIHGAWTVSAEDYVREVRRFDAEIGGLQLASICDWMCEDAILAKTGLSIAEHQRRTVESYLRLKDLAPELPWLPVLQGYTFGSYLDCVDLYAGHGIDLTREPLVGLGSDCRRQHTMRAGFLIRWLADDGLTLHAFGFKTASLPELAPLLGSADSMAWSLAARKQGRDPNALEEALAWREALMERIARAAERAA